MIEAREQAGLTQVALGGQLNRPRTFVWKYENGERRLDLVEFIEIARILGLDAHVVLDDLLKVTSESEL